MYVGSLGRPPTTDRAPPLANSSHPSFSLSLPGRPLSDPPASQPDCRPRPRPLASPAKDATSKPPNAARPPVASGSGHILLVAAPSRPLLTPYPSVPRGMPRPKAARAPSPCANSERRIIAQPCPLRLSRREPCREVAPLRTACTACRTSAGGPGAGAGRGHPPHAIGFPAPGRERDVRDAPVWVSSCPHAQG
jgi:hypothetical protein